MGYGLAELFSCKGPDAEFPPPVERLTLNTHTVAGAPASTETVETLTPVAKEVLVEASAAVDVAETPTSTPAPAPGGNTLETTSEIAPAHNPDTEVAVDTGAETPADELSRHVWDDLAAKVHAHT